MIDIIKALMWRKKFHRNRLTANEVNHGIPRCSRCEAAPERVKPNCTNYYCPCKPNEYLVLKNK